MSKKEQEIIDRMYELFKSNETWGLTKARAAAIAEDYRKRKVREGGKHSVRQFGWLDYT